MWFFLVLLGAGGAIALDRYRRALLRDEKDVTPRKETAVGFADPPTRIARGDVPVPVSPRLLPSTIKGVSDEKWTKFVSIMRTQDVGDVSPSNAVGCFEMMPRRLVDLGIIGNTKRIKSPKSGRMVLAGTFVPPMTEEKFTSSPLAQYNAFVMSMKDYVEKLKGKGIDAPEISGMTLSGALAILHKCGPSGLKTWADEANRFPGTQALYDAANGVF